ncbi:class I SAM-dependent methyltransferase [Natrarchaeobius chitinivorans]|nr:class I SAM-dependent methyltransferase [Natrarchaeobius chitinivorans]
MSNQGSFSGRNPIELVTRLNQLWREGGLHAIRQGAEDYLRHNTIILDRKYEDVRSDTDYRWEFINNHINDSTERLLDIGCAEGYFCARAAGKGINAVGIDTNEKRIKQAKADHPNVDFRVQTLSPDNVTELPESDIILCLTVHHGFVNGYGWDESVEMMKTILEKGDLLVYEGSGIRRDHPSLDEDLETIDYYRELLFDIYEDAEIIEETYTEYGSGERTDSMYIVDCSNI